MRSRTIRKIHTLFSRNPPARANLLIASLVTSQRDAVKNSLSQEHKQPHAQSRSLKTAALFSTTSMLACEKQTEEDSKLDDVLRRFRGAYNSDPNALLVDLPAYECWRFFVDGNQQYLGWQPFEDRQPGYLLAMTKAFVSLFNNPTVDAMAWDDLLKNLHCQALSGVNNTDYVNDNAKGIGLYRTTSRANHATLPKLFITDNDLVEQFSEIKKADDSLFLPFLLFYNEGQLRSNSYIFPDKINKLDRHPLHHINSESPSELKNILMTKRIGFGWMLLEKNEDTYSIVRGPNKAIALAVDKKVKTLMADYRHKIENASSKKDQLIAILNLTKVLEQIHPFYDGNTRTISMLFRNYLLCRYQFPPVYDTDPNDNCLLSQKNTLRKVTLGMVRTLDLVQGKLPCELHTEHYLSRLNPEQQHSFLRAVETVQNMQRKLPAPKSNLDQRDHYWKKP